MSIKALPDLPSKQAPTLVQHKTFAAGTATPALTLTMDAAPKLGNVLIAIFTSDTSAGDMSSITQTGVVWRPACGWRSSNLGASIWIGRVNSASPGTSITVGYFGSWPAFWVGEWANLAGFLVRSFVATANASSLTVTTDTQVGEGRYALGSLLIGGWAWDSGGAGPTSISGGWTGYAIGDLLAAWRLPDPSGATVSGQATSSRSTNTVGLVAALI